MSQKNLTLGLWILVMGRLMCRTCLAQEFASALPAPHELFVPTGAIGPAAPIELRDEATIVGSEVKLKSVCRWNTSDATFFAPVAELTVVKIPAGRAFKGVTVEQVRAALAGAGMNMGSVRFMGPMVCAITRGDAEVQTGGANVDGFDQWAEAHQTGGAAAALASAPVAKTQDEGSGLGAQGLVKEVRPTSNTAAPVDADAPVRTLKDILTDELAQHLSISADSLDVQFNDEKTAGLSEPLFRFAVTPLRVNGLGVVQWDITATATEKGGPSKRVILEGYAKQWQDQVIARRPLMYRQQIQDGDVMERRMLVDHMPNDPLLTREQVVGQQAAREVRVGSVFDSRLVEAIPLIKTGQMVTVKMTRGSFTVTTVGRAMEAGAFGQSIHVRNDETKDTFDVTVTGPQTGKME